MGMPLLISGGYSTRNQEEKHIVGFGVKSSVKKKKIQKIKLNLHLGT